MDFPKANLLNEEWREFIREWMLYGIRLWVVDNLGFFTSEDEKSKKEWDPIGKILISFHHDGISIGIIIILERVKTSAYKRTRRPCRHSDRA